MDALQAAFESVARYFSVLGEPTRLRILHALCREEKCVSEILGLTGLGQANASRHLGLMYQAGMLSRRRDGTQIFYRVADPMDVELCRSVSVQLATRIDGTVRDPKARFSDDLVAAVLTSDQARFSPTANHKEKESV